MVQIGYHCSHEQFSPRELLSYVRLAGQAGFSAAMSSEHIAPWSVRQGNSGFAWAWLGAALQATEELNFGALAIPGGWRYHPVVVAHAFATLAQMFPNRIPWIAAGSGESMNEHMVGQSWPDKSERNARLLAGVDIIRSLWRGETVTQKEPHKTHQAKLWTLPEVAPKIYGAALSVETATWMGEWADGLITVQAPVEELQSLIDGFRSNGGVNKPLVLQFQISWDASEEKARSSAHDQWRHAAVELERDMLQTPEEFDAACAHLCLEDMDKGMLVTSDAKKIIYEIKKYAALGFDEVFIHNVGRNQIDFIEFCRISILPFFCK